VRSECKAKSSPVPEFKRQDTRQAAPGVGIVDYIVRLGPTVAIVLPIYIVMII